MAPVTHLYPSHLVPSPFHIFQEPLQCLLTTKPEHRPYVKRQVIMALRHEFQWAADSALPKLPRAWSRELELLFRSEHKDVPAIEEKVGGSEGRRGKG